MTDAENGSRRGVAIILHSGAYERVGYALSLAKVALAMGSDVQILLVYDALLRFTRSHRNGPDDDTPAAIRERIERGLASGGIQPLDETLADAKVLGLQIYACASAMATLNVSRDELSEHVDGISCLASFLDFSLGAANTWYI